MCDLVARTGRQQQRYDAGCRLIAGVIGKSGDLTVIYNKGGQDYYSHHRLVLRWMSALSNRCIPFRYRSSDGNSDEIIDKVVEVLMIDTPSGPGLLFPKGGWENDETAEEAAAREAIEEAGVRGELMGFLGDYHFKSKSQQDEFCPDGLCRAAMYALFVNEELELWPEQNTRNRSWVTIPEAIEKCRHAWMRDALVSFNKWHDE